jgi:hypothetical protein
LGFGGLKTAPIFLSMTPSRWRRSAVRWANCWWRSGQCFFGCKLKSEVRSFDCCYLLDVPLGWSALRFVAWWWLAGARDALNN